MATRTTRSRSRQQSVEQEAQSKITDAFRVTRRGTMPGKLIKEEMDTITEYSAPSLKESYVVPIQPANDFVTPAPAVTKVTKKTTAKTTKKIKQEVVLPTEKVVVEAAVPPVLDSPPRRARKTPTPTNSPHGPKSSSVRKLVFNEEIQPKEEQPSEPIEIASSSHEAPITPPFGIKEKKAEDKIRSSAALQARIAEKSAAMKRLHAQNAVSKIRQVEEVANVLKSPKKALHISPIKKPSHSSPVKRLAPLFTTPSKRPEAIKINNPDGSASKVPGYVLPSHKTPAKEVDSDEEREQEQKRQQLEMGKSALLHDFVKKNINVPLPEKYQTLIDKFHCCDRIVSIFSGRGSRCEANEIFKNVSNNLRKDFNKTHLAQIMTVYPKSYNLRLEEQRNVSGKPIGRFDLVLDPNVVDDLTEFMRPESPVKQRIEEPMPMVLPGRCLSPQKSPRKKVAPCVAREAVLDLRPRLEGWRMTSRKYVMHHLLAARVKQFHQKFMEKMGEKIGEIRRFHPSFLARMDRECEDIEQGELPLPDKKDDNFKDVRQFMNSVDEPVTAVDIAIKELSGKGDISATRNIPLSPKKFAQLAASKPVGAKSLLERIREKEAQKKAAEAARDPAAERRHFLLELLQTKVLRSVLNIFVQKNCRSMELALVIEKLEYSTKRTKSELKECLELMCEVATEVSKVVEVASRKYLQIEKDQHDAVRSSLKTAFEKTPAPAFPFAAKAR